MLLGPRELLKKVRDKLEKGRDWNNRKEKESLLNLKLQDRDNFQKNNLVSLNKQESKERTT